MIARAALALGCLVASSACSVLEIPPPPEAIAINACNSEEQGACGSGVCENGACVARGNGELTRLIVEITPPSGAQSSGGIPFYLHVEELTGEDIEIDTVVHVTGKVTMPVYEVCNFKGSTDATVVREAQDASVPARVSFTPSERVLGIGVAAYSATVPIAEHEGTVSDVAAEHRFVADLPRGDYDVYVEPRPAALTELAENCKLLPVLVRNRRIDGDVEFKLPVPERLELTIRALPTDVRLDEWTVDLLDPTSGRVLSIPERVAAGSLNAAGDAFEYKTTVRYSTPLLFGDDGVLLTNPLEGQEVVRLRPPDGLPFPFFVYQRDGLQILGEEAFIDLRLQSNNVMRSEPMLPSVRIQGQTARLYDGSPVEATVTFLAEAVEGVDPLSASFLRVIEVDESGLFDLTAPPGRYSVRGFPKPGLELATANVEWVIGSTPANQAGKTVEFGERVTIDGQALVSGNGNTAYGASVRAAVTPWTVQGSVLATAGGDLPPPPLALGDLVARNGGFSLAADPGIYDFFIQPEARSRYPWYVRPSTTVPEDGRLLGEVRVPFPVIHRGRIVIRGTDFVVSDALIRVYAYVTAVGKYSPTPENFVVQVAETRADGNGAFELLIPASLDARQ
jgi:hypothetical protein